MSIETKRTWLILSYQTNRASACSQHIDDKLPVLAERGITPVILSSTGGKRHSSFIHKTALSIAPSGLRFELRSFLRIHCKTRFTFKLFETPFLLPILPLYLIEKIIIDLESEWSWYIRASQKGNTLCKRYQPELIYSTGGPACAHLAAYKISKRHNIPWIAELQDPIIHDAEYHRSKRAFRYYSWLEKLIRKKSRATLFMCDSAKQNCNRRTGITQNSHTVYPGACNQFVKANSKHPDKCVFNHFGTLAGSRDGTVLITAIAQCLDRNPALIERIKFNFYGTCDAATAKSIANFPYKNIVEFHEKIPRDQAIEKMNSSSCLILIQNREFFSSETIPSKLYEYLNTGRPILALTYNNQEIDTILHREGHVSVPADEHHTISEAIEKIAELDNVDENFASRPSSPWTTERAVDQLLGIAKTCIDTTG